MVPGVLPIPQRDPGCAHSDLATAGPVAFAMEGCTGWRYIAEEMAKAGVTAQLAEPADTSALRGLKRRPRTDKADAKLLRELAL